MSLGLHRHRTNLRSFPRKRESRAENSAKDWVPASAGTNGVQEALQAYPGWRFRLLPVICIDGDLRRMTGMQVSALGYVRARAKDLGDWASYGPGLLGLQRVDKSRSTIAFRMDDRKQRIIVNADGGQGIDVFGWEVTDAAALGALAARLEAAGVAIARGTRALADERLVKDLIVL